jgi:hypothetical protein
MLGGELIGCTKDRTVFEIDAREVLALSRCIREAFGDKHVPHLMSELLGQKDL